MDNTELLAHIKSQLSTELYTPRFRVKHHIARFSDPIARKPVNLWFGTGSFDDWCVIVQTRLKGYEEIPTDKWYFGILCDWARILAPEVIYADFVQIYDQVVTDGTLPATAPTIALIEQLSFKYPDYTQACTIWTILYMGMIAEENKGGKVLGKRIKRLGVYQVLMEGLDPVHAANYSRGKSTIELAPYCNERGF